MTPTQDEKTKAFVLEAFELLFNKRDYAAAEARWVPNYIQHSAHIPPGREGLFNLIRSVPAELRYEPGLILANKEFVIVHGRFSGTDGRATGSQPISCGSSMASSRSTGTCSRTRPPRKSREAAGPCSAKHLRSDTCLAPSTSLLT